MVVSIIKRVKWVIRVCLGIAANPRQSIKRYELFKDRRDIRKKRNQGYQKWFAEYQRYAADAHAQKDKLRRLKNRPLISIILPLYNTPEKFLRECIESVINQSYENWELCITDDASTINTTDTVKEYAKNDSRIKWTRNTSNMHIAGASNEAIKLAEGEFIALLDHDDYLMPNALYEVILALNKYPKTDFFYSDEDKLEQNGDHVEPFFKPDWSPDFLRACNYITHFAVLRKTIVDKIGGFRLGTEGAQDWDIFLRFVRESKNIIHIPKILYSWRKSETSTAKNAESKPYAYINQRRVLRDDLRQEDLSASICEHPSSGLWRVKYHIQNHPLVSIIIPTKDAHKVLKKCLESIIKHTTYPYFEVILVDTGSTQKAIKILYKSSLITNNQIKVLKWNKTFNFSSACNYGAKHSNGEYLLFLNNDTEVISPQWIEGLLEHAQRQEVGMVGCKLLFPDKTIQHAGIILRSWDVATHPFYRLIPEQDLFLNIYHNSVRNYSAVTAACSMVERTKFERVGGFDPSFRVTYNDVDICLRLIEAGYINVYTPFVKLYHHESVSIGRIHSKSRDGEELKEAAKKFKKRWQKWLDKDPYYNENFKQQGTPYHIDI